MKPKGDLDMVCSPAVRVSDAKGAPSPGLGRPKGSLKDSFYMIVKIVKFPLLY